MAFNENITRVWRIAALLPLLSGCSIFFDAPAESAAVSEQALSDLQAIAKEQVLESVGAIPSSEVLMDIAQSAEQRASQAVSGAVAIFNSAKVKRLSPKQDKEPGIYFEKISNPMPQLVVLSPGDAAIWWNDAQLIIPAGNSSHVVLATPGKQKLKITYPDAAAFKAEIDIARYERLTLRIDMTANAMHSRNSEN